LACSRLRCRLVRWFLRSSRILATDAASTCGRGTATPQTAPRLHHGPHYSRATDALLSRHLFAAGSSWHDGRKLSKEGSRPTATRPAPQHHRITTAAPLPYHHRATDGTTAVPTPHNQCDSFALLSCTGQQKISSVALERPRHDRATATLRTAPTSHHHRATTAHPLRLRFTPLLLRERSADRTRHFERCSRMMIPLSHQDRTTTAPPPHHHRCLWRLTFGRQHRCGKST